ncbi:glycosyltransferase family 39 protein [Paludisphaera rhizosphaerae]|uniref:glycosyltransferase family 39 protein n=1 Tax=Paludisphaera rhizosphaerae TaxID=2711216 RepID=UPI0013EAD331|nr:glycosyltransferase family 39 protein [Paludisphaera rhizosphaerae]
MRAWATAVAVLFIALGLRAWRLGDDAFWYDEVVTMRLAETSSPRALVDLLFRIDATRAPLHPMLLQGWLRAFGVSEASGRALSVLFGVGTVALLYPLGRLAFDRKTGLWAMGLGTLSPLLVYYSREVRMYALLVFLTTLAWTLLFWMRAEPRRAKIVAYVACLFLTMFTHPLALPMAATLAIASAMDAKGFFGTWRTWTAAHLIPVVASSWWLRFYFDHAPEFLSGKLPIKFLLGTPIGFLGGNFATLAGVVALIAWGLWRRNRGGERSWPAPSCLAAWLVLPPTVLYAYSWIGNPIFGPPRYTLYCSPAFLILVAQGMARLPALTATAAAVGVGVLVTVYAPSTPTKSDWRPCVQAALRAPLPPGAKLVVFVMSSAEPNVEAETARYYFGPAVDVRPFRLEDATRERRDPSRFVLVAWNNPDSATFRNDLLPLGPISWMSYSDDGPDPSRTESSFILYQLIPLPEDSPARPPAPEPPPAPGTPGR